MRGRIRLGTAATGAAAAELYAKAVAQDPGRDDLRIQLGNCLKEAGRFEAAFEAYRGVNSPSERDEANLQLGHLLKVSANYAAAREAYSRAASGSVAGSSGRGRDGASRHIESTHVVRAPVRVPHRVG